MIKYLLVASLTTILVFNYSCKPKDEYYPIPNQILKDALTVKQGSYFIYMDSLTNQLDTFNVFDFIDYYAEENKGKYYEQLSYRMKSSNNDEFSFSAGWQYLILIGGSYSTNRILNNGYTSQVSTKFTNDPFKIGLDSIANDKWENLSYYDSLKIKDIYYKNVYEIKSTTYGALNNGSMSIVTFFSTDIGLIKFKNESLHENYELVKKNIIK